jgi:hypothetical protein
MRLQVKFLSTHNEELRSAIDFQQDLATKELGVAQSRIRALEENAQEDLATEEMSVAQLRTRALEEENEKLRDERDAQQRAGLEDQKRLRSLLLESEQNSSLLIEDDLNEMRSKIKVLTLDNDIHRAKEDSLHSVRLQVGFLTFENEKLCAQKEADSLIIRDLRKLVNSLQNESSAREIDHEGSLVTEIKRRLRAEQHGDDCSPVCSQPEGPEQEARMSELALDQTMKRMKSHIESLEEEKQMMDLKCAEKDGTIASLREDLKLHSPKLEILEGLVKSHPTDSPPGTPTRNSQRWKLGWRKKSKVKQPIKAHRSQPLKVDEGEEGNQGKAGVVDHGQATILPSAMNAPQCTTTDAEPTARRMEIMVGDREATYTGPLSDGKPNGVGTIRFNHSRDIYLGRVVNGEMHGRGTLYHCGESSSMSRGRFEHNAFVDKTRCSF